MIEPVDDDPVSIAVEEGERERVVAADVIEGAIAHQADMLQSSLRWGLEIRLDPPPELPLEGGLAAMQRQYEAEAESEADGQGPIDRGQTTCRSKWVT